MLINRDNYETLFLLYVDGELAAEENASVEAFVSANPDLQQELAMLQDAVLPADEISFLSKSSLYKFVSEGNLQEKLLLKADDELPIADAAAIDSLIFSDPAVADEFELLLRTKSDPAEKIIFKEKHLLFRREKDNVVIGRFVRWAAAAVAIGFGLYFGASLLKQNNTVSETGTALQKEKNNVDVLPRNGEVTDPAALARGEQAQITDSANDRLLPEDVPSNSSVQQFSAKSNPVVMAATPDKKVNGLPEEKPQVVSAYDATALAPKINKLPVNVSDVQTTAPTLAKTEALQANPKADENIVPLDVTYASAVSYTNDDRNDNKILYMDEDDVRRSKAGGVFRKVKRFVERTAKIKTGSSLRIAGFEIAAK